MPDGTNKGIFDTRDAIELARSMHMDLIEVAPNADPPVCRILDYGRFTYEREKKERAARKSQKLIEVKGVQLRPKTTDHDLAFKIRAARRFLESGNKVKINMRFRGREAVHQHVALKLMDRFIQALLDIGFVEVAPTMEGKMMIAVVAPTRPRWQQPILRAPSSASRPSAKQTAPPATTRKKKTWLKTTKVMTLTTNRRIILLPPSKTSR